MQFADCRIVTALTVFEVSVKKTLKKQTALSKVRSYFSVFYKMQ